MFKTKIVFHQTLEIKEVLTFFPIRRTNKSVSQPILLYYIVYMYNVLTTAAAFQVILEAEENDNRQS